MFVCTHDSFEPEGSFFPMANREYYAEVARFFDIRPGEARPTAAAFLTLLATTAGHTMIETARDALFLAKLPPTHLPIVYVAIAATGLLMSRLTARSKKATPLPLALLLSAGVTFTFFMLNQNRATAFLYALYLWSGIFGSWVVVQFWMMLGTLFNVTQATFWVKFPTQADDDTMKVEAPTAFRKAWREDVSLP